MESLNVKAVSLGGKVIDKKDPTGRVVKQYFVQEFIYDNSQILSSFCKSEKEFIERGLQCVLTLKAQYNEKNSKCFLNVSRVVEVF